MKNVTLTLQYWKDGDWYVGQLVEVPGVMSQGETLEALQENIDDAYQLLLAERKQTFSRPRSKSIPILVHAWSEERSSASLKQTDASALAQAGNTTSTTTQRRISLRLFPVTPRLPIPSAKASGKS